MTLYLNKQSVVLPPDFSFEIVSTNPLIEKVGSFSIAIGIPIRGNEMLFGRPHEGLYGYMEFDAELRHEGLTYHVGRAVVSELRDNEASLTLLFGASTINSILLSRKPLSDLDLGDMPHLSEEEITSSSLTHYLNNRYSEYSSVCYPPSFDGKRFFNPIGAVYRTSLSAQTRELTVFTRDFLGLNSFVGMDYIPMPFVAFVLTRAFKALGFELDQGLLQSHELLSRMFFVMPRIVFRLNEAFESLTLLDVVESVERICELVLVQFGRKLWFVPTNRFYSKKITLWPGAIKKETYVERIEESDPPGAFRPYRFELGSKDEDSFKELCALDRNDHLFAYDNQDLYDRMRTRFSSADDAERKLIHSARVKNIHFSFLCRKIGAYHYPHPVDRFHPFLGADRAESLKLRLADIRPWIGHIFRNQASTSAVGAKQVLLPVLHIDRPDMQASYPNNLEDSFLKGDRKDERRVMVSSQIALLAPPTVVRLDGQTYYMMRVYTDFMELASTEKNLEHGLPELLPDLSLNTKENYPPARLLEKVRIDNNVRISMQVLSSALSSDTYVYSLNGQLLLLVSRKDTYSKSTQNLYCECTFIPCLPGEA